MNKVTPEMVHEAYKSVADSFLENGDMFMDDQSAMAEELDKVSKELGLSTPPQDNYPITKKEHLAFVRGAEWGFRRASMKYQSKKQKKHE